MANFFYAIAGNQTPSFGKSKKKSSVITNGSLDSAVNRVYAFALGEGVEKGYERIWFLLRKTIPFDTLLYVIRCIAIRTVLRTVQHCNACPTLCTILEHRKQSSVTMKVTNSLWLPYHRWLAIASHWQSLQMISSKVTKPLITFWSKRLANDAVRHIQVPLLECILLARFSKSEISPLQSTCQIGERWNWKFPNSELECSPSCSWAKGVVRELAS